MCGHDRSLSALSDRTLALIRCRRWEFGGRRRKEAGYGHLEQRLSRSFPELSPLWRVLARSVARK